MSTTVFRARRVVTMDPARPVGTHVAVRDGRVLAVGSAEDVGAWGPHDVDDRFAEHVLLPGLIDGHAHVMEGAYWRFPFCGYFDRTDPDGRVWPGLTTLDALVAHLREAQRDLADERAPLLGWGFDPLYFGGRRVDRHDLDAVSAVRPIAIIHASGHVVTANSAALALAGYLRDGVDHAAIPLGPDGLPNGELRIRTVWEPVVAAFGVDWESIALDGHGVRQFARLAVRSGVTTSTDLVNPLADAAVDLLAAITAEESFPLRLVPALFGLGQAPADVMQRAIELRSRSTDRLRLGAVKLIADGSIQGYTARLLEPGYVNGAPNGLWYIGPEQLRALFAAALDAGVQVHIHTNGDQATQLAIDSFAEVARHRPTGDHRTVLQHCQLASRAQLRQMRALGLCANFFANHHFFWGDLHHASTVGPDRAERMNPCRSAEEIGVPYSVHSDAPVTPLAPLHVAWCAVNRLTASGRRLGEYERLSVDQALRAITLGAAYTLRLDHEIGSIECGKRADFAVLEQDPYEVAPEALKDVGVWGTVLGGRVFAAADA